MKTKLTIFKKRKNTNVYIKFKKKGVCIMLSVHYTRKTYEKI